MPKTLRTTIKLLGVSVLLIQLADIATTWLAVFYVGGTEMNPLLAPIVRTWVMPMWKTLVGIGVPTGFVWISNAYDDQPWLIGLVVALLLTNLASIYPVLWNLEQLLFILSLKGA